MTVITFIFILLIVFSFGWKEVAYSFFDIHVGNVVKLRWYGIGMLLSMGLGMYILSVMDTRLYTISSQEVFILASAMMVTIALLWMIQRHYSCVTAFFGAMLAFGLAFIIIMQAMINMGVSTGLMPVTGQQLPFISKGGSSMLMTGFAIGMILSVTRSLEEEGRQETEEGRQETEDGSQETEDRSQETEELVMG